MAREPAGEAPEVTVDFAFDDGLLSVVVANTSSRAALAVRVAFDPPFRGLGGSRAMNRLTLFRKLEFLAPGREIRALVDSSAAYFARKEPTRVTAKVTFRDEAGRRYSREIVHDLSIYRDLAYPAS
jgi:hypothetical protein